MCPSIPLAWYNTLILCRLIWLASKSIANPQSHQPVNRIQQIHPPRGYKRSRPQTWRVKQNGSHHSSYKKSMTAFRPPIFCNILASTVVALTSFWLSYSRCSLGGSDWHHYHPQVLESRLRDDHISANIQFHRYFSFYSSLLRPVPFPQRPGSTQPFVAKCILSLPFTPRKLPYHLDSLLLQLQPRHQQSLQ